MKLEINGEEVDVVDLITDAGIAKASSILANPNSFSDSWMPFIAIGDGLIPPANTDPTLSGNELYRKRGSVSSIGNTFFIEATFLMNEPVTDCVITEVAIFDAIAGGILGARWLLVSDVPKNSDEEVYVRCSITLL
jgi:hypothetical protein